MFDHFPPFPPFHLHRPTSPSANNLNQLTFSSALLSLSLPDLSPLKKTPLRVELDLYFAGKQTSPEEEMYRRTASFLGSAGASLVDLDDLFSSDPKPKPQRPLVSAPAAQTQVVGKDRTSTPLWVRSNTFNEGFAWISFVLRLVQTDA